jgi:hypothetical protein
MAAARVRVMAGMVGGAVDSLILGTAEPHRRVKTLRNPEETHKER